MRSLFVALCVCSLAIAARATCTPSETRPCNGNGKCNTANWKCECNTVVGADGVTTKFLGEKCDTFNSWWYTNTTSLTCQDTTCNGGRGDHENGKCKCVTKFDGNVTTEYSGQCCNTYHSWWQWGTSWKTGGNATSGSASCTSAGCSGHGTCVSGKCECTKITDKDRVTEYYGPYCNSWHSYWSWSSSSGMSRSDELGSGAVWAADGIGMRESRQEWYCYCDNITQNYFDNNDKQGTICVAFCNATYTCNAHGTCNTTSQGCKCNIHFGGRWCDQCQKGWGNKNTSDPNQLCNVCAPGFYPTTVTASNACTKECWDGIHCSGHGVCNANGGCDCKPGYMGADCGQCKPSQGYRGGEGNLSCIVCDPEITCKGYGICGEMGKCQCGAGFGGDDCSKCTAGGTFPKCVGGQQRAAAGAAEDECPGPNLALPIILSILGTLLVMLIAFAIYRMWAAKQAGAGGAGTAKSSNWSEFEKDSSTAYSQL